MIAEEVNPDVTKVPQLWCLYKEVQEYYEKGLRVPDDVTLLWSDDNWGNLRRLPTEEERKRPGGAGIYYHFDYVGGPRSYKWLNTIQIEKVWEQMNLAYNYGATRIWIVNVGDLKPMEYPIDFFMNFAWDPQKWPKEKMSEYGKLWAQREFGQQYAADIADIMTKYTKYNARRKPELLEPTTFSLVNYNEADTVVADWNAITIKAEQIYEMLPANAKDAFFQLVLYPTKASAIVTELYVTAGKNRLYAEQNHPGTNALAEKARALFKADADLANYYNKTMANGKWNHMMDQTHIGYTSWNQPSRNVMPEVKEINNPAEPNKSLAEGFVEADGYVSIEAEHYTRKIDAGDIRWEKIDNYGRTLSSMTIFPVTSQSVAPPKDSPCLEYKMHIFNPGNLEVEAILAPSLNFVPGRGLRFALSFDDQPPQIIDIVPAGYDARNGNADWEQSVKDSARKVKSKHTVANVGYHTLKVWMVDPGVVLQKIVINMGGLKPSYLGPPESFKGGTASGAFKTGVYRNLFVEAGKNPQDVAAKVEAAFKQLFYGNPETEAIYFPAGSNANGPLAQIRDIGNNDIRSEGMSYGMMIAVQLDKKQEFDALWNWAKTYMYHDSPNHPAYGYFSWQMTINGKPIDEMPAADGEEYFATALYFASARWGNGKGIYDYRAQADRLLTDMKNRSLITGPTVKGIMTAGNLFDPNHKMVRFTPDIVNWQHTDPSYHLPAFYDIWALCGPQDDISFWPQAAKVSRDFFQKAANPVTGLTPEYANFDGTPWECPWNIKSDDFQFDAWRTAMNWSVDYAWWGKDARERQLSDKLQAFFESKGITSYGNQFTLDGNQFGSEHSAGLVACNAVVSLAATHPRARQFVEQFWDTPVPTGQWRYYDGTLYMLAMLHCSGQFKIRVKPHYLSKTPYSDNFANDY